MKPSRHKATIRYIPWILVAITGANLAIHALRAKDREDLIPVGLRIGDVLPDLHLRPLGSPPDPLSTPSRPGGCRLLVAFSLDCPYCGIAAAREADRSAPDRIPIHYISKTDDSRVREYMASLGSPIAVWYGDDAFRRLKVKAVPAGILVSADNIVKKAFVYLGDEDHTALRQEC